MRKLKLQMQVTLDGFVAGPNGELEWMNFNWDKELQDHVFNFHKAVDLILMGRKMTDGFVKYWANVVEDPKNPEYEFARMMHDNTKLVFSRTLDKTEWVNTELAKRNVVDEVNDLKKKDGGDIVVYGGATFVSSLIQNDLIDEYNFYLNPVAIGKGMTIFRDTKKINLNLITSRSFPCGIVLLSYESQKK